MYCLVLGEEIKVDNTEELISIVIQANPEGIPEVTSYSIPRLGKMNFHKISITSNDSSLHITVKPDITENNLTTWVFVR